MANHSSSIKRIRQINSRRLHNRYYARTTRNAVRKLRELTDRKEAEELLKKFPVCWINWQNAMLFIKTKPAT